MLQRKTSLRSAAIAQTKPETKVDSAKRKIKIDLSLANKNEGYLNKLTTLGGKKNGRRSVVVLKQFLDRENSESIESLDIAP